MPPIPIVIAFVVCALFFLPATAAYGPVEFEVLMRIGISFVLLLAALWVILSKRYVPTDRHWAYGTIGTIVGYWLGR